LYVIVRRDLPLAHQAVQAIHAGIASARELIPAGISHPSLVLCTVPDQAALSIIEKRCAEAGVRCKTFREADMDDQPTALATEPVRAPKRRVFQDLPLFTGA
jgi:hypothetical protein